MSSRWVRALCCLWLAGSRCLAQDAPPADAAERFACDALKAIDLSEAIGAGARVLEAGILPAASDQPALCRVNGTIEPEVGFEVRMPVNDWNGKLLVTGCSNLCGILQIQGMEDALARGYAAATTDMGHRTGDPSDARWAWNNPVLETDFGHRATHVTTLAAKELAANYYGDRPSYSYFRGCSTGGRQGLVAAERYPEDFDGIIAGAPFNQSLSVPHMAWVLASNAGPGGEPLLKRAEFALLGKAAIRACDPADGIVDGVIGNPEACDFRPDSLACPAPAAPGSAARDCLSPAQVEAANRIYRGPRTGKGKAWSSGGSPLGSEFTWEKALLAPPGKKPFFQFIVENWSQYLAWVPDPPVASSSLPAVNFDAGPSQFAATAGVAGYRPDLERFRSHGGRLLLYHGWVDESLMPAHTLDYWRDARRRFAAGGQAGGTAGEEQLAEFARLFMVPGMLHCGGGPGAADIDYLSALERWVEADEAPARLLAHKVRNAVPTFVRQPRFPLPPNTVEYTRPIFPWPNDSPGGGQPGPAGGEGDANSSRLPLLPH
ncbi:MAG: tannase/feruloyl esterase family alpha/beta hydrolase [Gammaproteobacteria bacterium]